MKELWNKIADIVCGVDFMDRDTLIGILNPLETESQAKEMINYLEENKDNIEVMRVDNLLRKALEIGN